MRHGSLVVLTVAAVLWTGLPAAAQRGGPPVTLPDGQGKEIVETTCSRCHGLNMLGNSGGYTRERWPM